MSSIWDDQRRIELLRELWGKGLSTTEIALRMGVSKMTVVGKAHRLDLPAKPRPLEKKRPGRTLEMNHDKRIVPPLNDIMPLSAKQSSAGGEPPATPTRVAPSVPALDSGRLFSPVEIVVVGNNQCCFPFGHPRTAGFKFCCKASVPGKPYCPECMAVAYVRVRDGA
jgi:GcrA cell cycle regulator